MGKELQRGLLFTFFLRENPNGDPWVYEGFGPMRRRVKPGYPKTSDGKWDFVFGDKWNPKPRVIMPNPDCLVDMLTVPLEDASFDLVQAVSGLERGSEWLEACEMYLGGWEKKMPKEMPFEIQLSDMPGLWYVEDMDSDTRFCRDDLWKLESLPEGMYHGTFHPLFFGVPWTKDKEKIGMRCNGGVLTPSNDRWGYTSGESTCGIYISLPWQHQLIGEMQKCSFTRGDGKEPSYYLYNHVFPRTHFLEYVFAKHCPEEEPNLCPGIRIELKPEDMNKTTIMREQKWAFDNRPPIESRYRYAGW